MPTISRNYKSGGIESSEVDLNLYPRNTNGVVTPSAGLLNAPADLDPPLTISTNGTEDNYEQKAVDISGDTACRSYTTAFGWSPWLVQGTAAYADVQDSPTDTTAGRLMAVGAGGWLTDSLTAITTDLNDVIVSSYYRVSGSAPNVPTPSGGYMMVMPIGTLNTCQIFVGASGENDMYLRTRSGTWSAWKRVDPQAFGLGADAITIDLTTVTDLNSVIFKAISGSPISGLTVFGLQAGDGSGTGFRVYGRNGRYFAETVSSGVRGGADEIYTGANYQPEISLNGLGVVRFMQNNSGGSIGSSATVSGTSLKVLYFDSTGQGQFSSVVGTGTWKNVTGRPVANLESGLFVRIA